MEIEGTRAAFMAVVTQPGFAARSGINKATTSLWSAGTRVPTLDKMEEVLMDAGALILKEKVWSIMTETAANFQSTMSEFYRLLQPCLEGDEITVDMVDHSEVLVNNALNRHAATIGCLVSRDDSRRPEVTYKFVK